MSALLEASHALTTSDDPADQLERADRYLAFWEKDKDNFVLPAKHAALAPILAAFAGKPDLFRPYVRAMRDEVRAYRGASSSQYDAMQQFVRRLDVRAAQRMRRDKLTKVSDWMREQRPDVAVEARNFWLRRLEQRWAGERMEALRSERKAKGESLTSDEKRAVLDQFWQDVDQRIAAGDLPQYEELTQCPGATQP